MSPAKLIHADVVQFDPQHKPIIVRQTFTVDASHNHVDAKIGIGILIQETAGKGRRGPIIEQRAETWSPDEIHPKDMELFAIFRAFQIAMERKYSYIRVRSDYNFIRKQVNNAIKNKQQASKGSLLEQTLELARTFEEANVSYCPRRKNSIAHGLARKGAKIVPKPKQNHDDEMNYWQYEQYESEMPFLKGGT